MTRTLVLSPDYEPAPGGIQVLVTSIVEHTTGCVPMVLTLAVPGDEEFDARQPFCVRRIGLAGLSRTTRIGLLNASAVQAAVHFRPDVVLSGHTVMSPASSIIRRLLRVPVVQYVYGREVGSRPRLAGHAVRNAEAIVAISRYTRELALGVGAHPDRIHIITPGVDPQQTPPAPSRGSGDGRPTIITVARLEERYKGHDQIIRALGLVRSRVPDVRYVVIGEGPLRASLQQLAIARGLGDHVHFAGRLSTAERDAAFRNADVFVMPSRLPASKFAGEGFGIVYLEAGSMGVPVVAGAVAGPLDAVRHDHTGLLVDPTDHIAIAEAISGLLLDRGRASRLGAQGFDHARQFAWPAIAAKVQRLLEDTASAGVQRA